VTGATSGGGRVRTSAPWAAPVPGRPEVPSLITPRSHRPARGTRRPAAGQRIDAHRHDEHRIVHAGPGGVAVTAEAALPGLAPGTRAIRVTACTVHSHRARGRRLRGTSPRSGSRCACPPLPTAVSALAHTDSADTGTPDHRTRTVHHPVLTVE
jgi:hypothetical protein